MKEGLELEGKVKKSNKRKSFKSEQAWKLTSFKEIVSHRR
jgi:hypothetical protein